ncbi:CpaD family pilus assembly protein [Aestuariivirga litoralis]|uniref:CpaD family pilus assembly protein n=1 Tax=Aestuariivirga litoralis TaxID=2650924 RepID=UPI0018C6EBD9|nr:CpaD family pilus assembly lipoprotein [Aestuariivirga litoralis]
MQHHTVSFSRFTTSLLLVASLFTLSGCMADQMMTGSTDPAPSRGSDRFPIEVVKGPQILQIDARGGRLSLEQTNAVRSFVHQAQAAGVTPMTVSRPSGKGPSFQIAGEVARVLSEEGVQQDRVHFETYRGAGNGPVRISFVSSYAKTKTCGDWSEDLTTTASNDGYPNLGCAVQSNIAAMVANPETLDVPKPASIKQAGTSVLAVQRQERSVNEVTIPSNYGYTP